LRVLRLARVTVYESIFAAILFCSCQQFSCI